jgi:hypothetical protein
MVRWLMDWVLLSQGEARPVVVALYRFGTRCKLLQSNSRGPRSADDGDLRSVRRNVNRVYRLNRLFARRLRFQATSGSNG